MSAQVVFHFNAPSVLGYSCRLLRKAVALGNTVAVYAHERWISELDAMLWGFDATSFVPHGLAAQMTPTQREHTPIWLCGDVQQGQGRKILLNLSPEIASGLEGFECLIEVVSQDAASRQAARARWKHYVQSGLRVSGHDLASSENT